MYFGLHLNFFQPLGIGIIVRSSTLYSYVCIHLLSIWFLFHLPLIQKTFLEMPTVFQTLLDIMRESTEVTYLQYFRARKKTHFKNYYQSLSFLVTMDFTLIFIRL